MRAFDEFDFRTKRTKSVFQMCRPSKPILEFCQSVMRFRQNSRIVVGNLDSSVEIALANLQVVSASMQRLVAKD